MYTYSVLSTVGVVGMIISMQLTKMVVIINSENKGCTRIYIATLLMGLNGFNIHRASVAENLKISLPLLMTTKVWNKNNTFVNTRYHMVMLCDFQLIYDHRKQLRINKFDWYVFMWIISQLRYNIQSFCLFISFLYFVVNY